METFTWKLKISNFIRSTNSLQIAKNVGKVPNNPVGALGSNLDLHHVVFSSLQYIYRLRNVKEE